MGGVCREGRELLTEKEQPLAVTEGEGQRGGGEPEINGLSSARDVMAVWCSYPDRLAPRDRAGALVANTEIICLPYILALARSRNTVLYGVKWDEIDFLFDSRCLRWPAVCVCVV